MLAVNHCGSFSISGDDAMLTKIYLGAWALSTLAAVVVLATGQMSEMAMVVFGFLSFGLIFMGLISVLPSSVHEWTGKH
jgi:hypothetical protein